MLEATARDALGDPAAAGRALERALDLGESDGALMVFVLHPAPGLLERHARHSTSHAALISEILNRLPRLQSLRLVTKRRCAVDAHGNVASLTPQGLSPRLKAAHPEHLPTGG
jgi:hypothetical protein